MASPFRRFSDLHLRAIEACGLDYQTLRNYAWVARKFELDRRRETLSFQHHAEVSSVAPGEQDKWLDPAEEFNWSRNELRRNIRAHRQRDTKSEPPKEYLPKLSVPADGCGAGAKPPNSPVTSSSSGSSRPSTKPR